MERVAVLLFFASTKCDSWGKSADVFCMATTLGVERIWLVLGNAIEKTEECPVALCPHSEKADKYTYTYYTTVVGELETSSVNLNATLLNPCWILMNFGCPILTYQDLCVTQLERSLWRLCVDLASPAGWRGEMRQLPYPTWGVEVDNFQIFPDAWSSPWSNHQTS